MGSHQESTGDRQGDDAHDDEEERGDPLGGQPRRNTGPVPSVDGLTLPDQPDCQGACREKTPLAKSPLPVKESIQCGTVSVPGGTLLTSKGKGQCSDSRSSGRHSS